MNDVAYYTYWEQMERDWLDSLRLSKELREQEVKWWRENRKCIYDNLTKWRDELDKLKGVMMNFMQTGEVNGHTIPFRQRKAYEPLVEFILYRFARKTLEHRIRESERMLASIGALENHKEGIDIDEVKQVPIETVLSRYGIQIRPGSFIFSPYHKEKTASCKIYKNHNSFYDYSTAQGGSVIDLVMALDNCDVKTAIETLAGM